MEIRSEQNGEMLIIKLVGNFTFFDNLLFKSIFTQADQTPLPIIKLDLSALNFIDSAGLGMLLMLRDRCTTNNKKLILDNPVGQVKKVFTISKFDEFFEMQRI